MNKSIFRFDPHTGRINHMFSMGEETVESMSFDHLGNNLYKSNPSKKKIEVHSVTTGEMTEFYYTEKPYALLVVPEEG